MPEALPIAEAVLEVISNDGAKRYVRVTQTPFLMGRGAETGNHLQLNDRRISRRRLGVRGFPPFRRLCKVPAAARDLQYKICLLRSRSPRNSAICAGHSITNGFPHP